MNGAMCTLGRCWRRLVRNQSGQVGGVETLALGVLVLVGGTLLVLNAWAVVDARMMVSAAAREGLRAAAEASSSAQADHDARAAVHEAALGYGRDPARVDVDASSLPAGFRRCGMISLSVTYHVPALTVPFVGGLGRGFTVRGRHAGLVDPYSDGSSDGSCA